LVQHHCARGVLDLFNLQTKKKRRKRKCVHAKKKKMRNYEQAKKMSRGG